MELMFIGAAHEVTGSCHFLHVNGRNILVDYGMEQGVNVFENVPLPVDEVNLDYVLLTHAHVDHSGMLPLLYAKGFRGQVFMTYATADLCSIMLRDCAHIQQQEAEWKSRKALRSGKPAVEPPYTMEDAMGIINCIVPCAYNSKITICDGVEIRFTDIGHLLGSSSIEVWATEGTETRKLVFSGDIGNIDQPLIKDPSKTSHADYVIMESTYGDRIHTEEKPDYVGELASIIQETFDRGGNVVIPSFAVGRTQEILYFIRQIKAEGLICGHDNFKVYMDSPLAVEATGIFGRNIPECFDEEAMSLVNRGINPIQFKGLTLAVTSDESKMINFDDEPKVIISASGMCDAGRIRHHLKHNLWRPECTILFVGYQSIGTLGRALVDGVDEVKLFGETIQVEAEIRKLIGLSGHADKNGLIDWVQGFQNKPKKVFVVHGEDSVCKNFVETLQDEYGLDAYAPYSGTRYDLLEEKFVEECVGVPVEKKKAMINTSAVYDRLVGAAKRLMKVVEQNKGGANKDLAKFADQILALCEKWKRE